MPATDIQEVLAGLKSAQQKPLDMLTKSTFTESMSQTSGLTFYDLELGAKFVYPVLTPLRNAIPRVSGKGGLAANWRSVTAINTQNMRFGVSAANRGGVLAVATQDYSAAYKGIGVETSVDFEAQYAGQGFDDVRAVAAKTGLESLMLGEEAMILGGCASSPLGTTPTPTLSDVGTGGSLAANLAQSVICVALTHDGVINATLASGIQGQITRTNADGTTDTFGGGAAARSANATITTANDGNATHLIRASVARVAGALGYAWFWGAAGAETLGAITSIASATIASAATGNPGDTGALSYLSGGTTRASAGLLASDRYRVSVSTSGASFTQALDLDPATGHVGLAGYTADANNALGVLGTACLFAASTDSMRFTFSKVAAANDATLSFQTSFSARALLGTTGSDQFQLKVSPDGSTYYQVVVCDQTNGNALFKALVGLASYTVASLPSSAFNGAFAFASNGRKAGEAAGAGTGVVAAYSNGAWRRLSDDSVVVS